MTVEEAIKRLQALPPSARLMGASLAVGGSVGVLSFEQVDAEWVDVVLDESNATKEGDES